ncbi:Hypothetical predicted protein [Paramuricea clavata]|uniref:DUF6589 domain-containing protein n=1 Tax=Paramuricea clavata TaxID=317549 RepID=A0A6S7GPI8_PARCT|nr:Hypothetical predicted protein [Paramuricea clavata]
MVNGMNVYTNQLCAGDQLSVERAVYSIHSVSNGYTPEDRLEGFRMQLGVWHTGVKILELLFRRCYYASSSDDECSIMYDRNVINRRNVIEDPHQAYRADKDFLVLEVTARVIFAAYQVLGLSESTSQPKHFPNIFPVSSQGSCKDC